MSDCKRCAPSIAAMEASSSGGATMSKKRKTSVAAASASCNLKLHSSETQPQHLPNSHDSLPNFHDITVSPETSVNSPGTVVSGEFCSDRSPLSCCSSSYAIETGEVVKELHTTPLDLELQTKGFKTVEHSTYHNFKSFSLLSEFSGDSEESAMFPAKSPALKMPPKEEIEEFFAMAEKYERKRFAEKYNFDIVTDMPLEGRYQWVRLH